MTPKVSIVVPVYNVEKYLSECLDSIVSQTLKDIEIIVVNDGSTDNSLSIAERYANHDNRIIIVNKENRGYGHSMNQGFEKASGEYIGIVESDDCASPQMFEELYSLAAKCDADVVRSNYFTMSNGGKQFDLIDLLGISHAPYNVTFNPKDCPDIFRGSPAIWTGLYKRSFIRENAITFLESPGASYQDTGFILKTLAAADKVAITRKAFLNYRIDNAGSSVKSGAKVFCVCDEYASFEAFLSNRPERAAAFRTIIPVKKYETYLWNYNRLDKQLRPEFLARMRREFSEALQKGNLDKSLFAPIEWEELQSIIDGSFNAPDKDLTVVPAKVNEGERLKTQLENNTITRTGYLIRKAKRFFGAITNL